MTSAKTLEQLLAERKARCPDEEGDELRFNAVAGLVRRKDGLFVPFEEHRAMGLKAMNCACCGVIFYGWQHPDRDTGFGICSDEFCSNAYGYTTEGEKPHGT